MARTVPDDRYTGGRADLNTGHRSDELKAELLAGGFGPNGAAPNDTMALDDGYLSAIELAELLDTMIARPRRSSGEIVGAEARSTASTTLYAPVRLSFINSQRV